MKSEQTALAAVTVTPFVRRAMTGERVNMPAAVLSEGEWTEIVFTVPELGGDAVHDVGWTVETKPDADPWVMGRVYAVYDRRAGVHRKLLSARYGGERVCDG